MDRLIECEGFFLHVLGQEEPPDRAEGDPADAAAARWLWAARERPLTAYAAGLDDAAAWRAARRPGDGRR